MLDSLMPFTSWRCWQRDVPPCCSHHGAHFKGYQLKFQDRNQRDEEGEIDSKSFDERGLRWKKLSKHKRLLHSCSFLLSVPAVTLQDSLPVSYFCFELWTQTGVVAGFMYNAARLSLSIFTRFLVCRCRCVQSADHQPFDIERCEKRWKEKENK